MLQQPRIQRMPHMGQHPQLRTGFLNALQRQRQVIVISRRLRLRRHGAIQHQHVQRFALQPGQGLRWQADGVGEVGDASPLAFQQVAQG